MIDKEIADKMTDEYNERKIQRDQQEIKQKVPFKTVLVNGQKYDIYKIEKDSKKGPKKTYFCMTSHGSKNILSRTKYTIKNNLPYLDDLYTISGKRNSGLAKTVMKIATESIARKVDKLHAESPLYLLSFHTKMGWKVRPQGSTLKLEKTLRQKRFK